MLTLSMDTSTEEGSVALMRGETVVWEERFGADRSHSATLFPLIERALSGEQGAVSRVVVGVGPGSYAGIRVSIAAAMGLAFSRDVELVGVVSVAGLRPFSSEPFLAFGDARRGAWYWCLVQDGCCKEGPEVIEEAEFAQRWAGLEGVSRIACRTEPNWPADAISTPSAAALGVLAERGCSVVQRGELDPLYLREPHITQPGRKAAVFGKFGAQVTERV